MHDDQSDAILQQRWRSQNLRTEGDLVVAEQAPAHAAWQQLSHPKSARSPAACNEQLYMRPASDIDIRTRCLAPGDAEQDTQAGNRHGQLHNLFGANQSTWNEVSTGRQMKCNFRACSLLL